MPPNPSCQDDEKEYDVYCKVEDAAHVASQLSCAGTHMHGEKHMPCRTHEEYVAIRKENPAPIPAWKSRLHTHPAYL